MWWHLLKCGGAGTSLRYMTTLSCRHQLQIKMHSISFKVGFRGFNHSTTTRIEALAPPAAFRATRPDLGLMLHPHGFVAAEA